MDTLIPTPSGWTLLGALQVGDYVFDHSGAPTRVLAVYDDMPPVAYRVTFSDGATLDACADHLWTTWTHANRKSYHRTTGRESFDADWPAWRSPSGSGPTVRTTQDIVNTLTHNLRDDRNHSVPVCGALQLPPVDLLIPPYVLGAWLGDGTSREAGFTVADADADEMLGYLAADDVTTTGRPMRRPGARCATYSIGGRASARDASTGRLIPNGGLRSKLAELAVLNAKHVPATYLRAAATQRLDLLQGLMDTDGGWSGTHVEFGTTTYALATGVAELARSLGQKAVIKESRAMLNGQDYGPRWRVTWTPTVNPFRLRRKADKYRASGPQMLRNHHRMVVAVDRITPEPMRCITVESPHGLFLAGESMIPTHNTWSGAHILAEMILSDAAPGEWGIIAPTFEDGWATCVEGPSGILDAFGTTAAQVKQGRSALVKTWHRSWGELRLHNGHLIRVASADDGALRVQGKNLKGAWCDEIGLWENWETAWIESIGYAVRMGKAQIIATGTPKSTRKARALVKLLLADPTIPVRRLRTIDNAANLAPAFLADVVGRAKGTRLERQELDGDLIEDVEGALWTMQVIDDARILPDQVPDLTRIVVAIDPAVTANSDSDETGIIVVGECAGHGYVLADYSLKGSPNACMARAVHAYREWNADRIIAEVNNGGDYIGALLRTVDPNVPYQTVRATRGKWVRAEPAAAVYEQLRVHHAGTFPILEDQLCSWVPDTGKSPDRLDALVWGITALKSLSVGSWSDAYGISRCEHCDEAYMTGLHPERCPHCRQPHTREEP